MTKQEAEGAIKNIQTQIRLLPQQLVSISLQQREALKLFYALFGALVIDIPNDSSTPEERLEKLQIVKKSLDEFIIGSLASS